MTRHHQLKNEARRAEQRSDWARAIELYKSAIRIEDERGSGSDVGVYNRVGDLYLRQGDTASAVEYYEQASDRYASHGLHTSAIALCNKILRIAPDRDEVYGRLARLHASTGLLAEARSAFLRFAERMRETDRLSEALEAVQDLVSLTGDEELRTAFAEQLAAADLQAQAVAQLRLVYEARVASGGNSQDVREKILALDPDADPVGVTTPPPPRAAPIAAPESLGHRLADIEEPVPHLSAPISEPGTSDGEPAAVPAGTKELDSRLDEIVAEVPGGHAGEDPDVESVLDRFRSQVREVVEESDHTVHHDLGVSYMGMELFEDAIGEFRLAMQSPALAESASALLAECVRARGGRDIAGAVVSELPAEEGPSLPLARPDGTGAGPSLDPGPPVETRDSPVRAATEAIVSDGPEAPGSEVAPDDEPAAAADDEELADMLFQARLAQHRARAATEEGRVDHEAHLALGRTYERMGLTTEAVRDLVEAVEGPLAVKSEALELLERIISSEAIEAPALTEGMATLMKNERSDTAITAGRNFVQRQGIREVDRQAVLRLLPVEEPAADTEEGEGEAPGAAGEALAELGDVLSDLDEIASDELDLEAVSRPFDKTPPGEDPLAIFGEAEGLRAAGRMDEAESHYYRALELFEKNRDALNAIRAVDRLLGLRPDDVVLHHQKNEFAIMTNDRELLVSSYLDLAACLRRQNGFRSARTVYGRILDLDPQNAEARAGIAAVDADQLARERRRMQQPERRSPRESVAPSPAPGTVEVVQVPAEIDAMFQDLNAEGEDGENEPPDYESHYELGIAFQQMEMWDEAAREFKRAVQGMTDPLPAYEALGQCLLALRRYDEVKRTLGVAVTQPGPDEARAGVLFHLGLAHLRSGDAASARTCLERVLAIQPARADAAQLLSSLPA